MKRRSLAFVAAASMAALVATAPEAQAQRHRPVRGVESTEPPPDQPTDLRGRFGLDRIESLLARDEPGATLRAIERARTFGTPEALALIAPQRDPLVHVRGDSRAAIALVRALAEHTGDPDARHALGTMLNVAAGGGRREDRLQIGGSEAERFELARGLAATALASSHEAEATALLEAARDSGGSPGRAAATALHAYPPQRLTAKTNAPTLDEARVTLATSNGDLRGLDDLGERLSRSLATTPTPATSPVSPTLSPPPAPPISGASTRAHLLERLSELGDTRVLVLARMARHDESLRIRVAAARVLAAFGDAEAAAACADLIKDDATLAEGIELARDVGRQASGAALLDLVHAVAARLAASSDLELRRGCLAALGAFPSAEAVTALAPFLADETLAVDAAEALARSSREEAVTALTTFARATASATKGSATRLALRAAIVRRALRGEALPAFDALATSMASGRSAADRAVARAYLVVAGRLETNLALADAAPEVRRAVLAVAPFDRALAVHAAATDADAVVRTLAYAQLESAAPELVASAELQRRLRDVEVDAPLAARVLASRATTSDDAMLALLHASDPLVAREAVRGFAHSGAPDRAGRLAEIAQSEPDVEIRRAALAGLAQQTDPSAAVVDVLAGSALLDPDAYCRALARGIRLAEDTREVAWLHSDRRPGAAPYLALFTTAASVRALAFDDDGDAIVVGVSAAPKQLRLAPRVPAYNAAAAR